MPPVTISYLASRGRKAPRHSQADEDAVGWSRRISDLDSVFNGAVRPHPQHLHRILLHWRAAIQML